MQNVKVTLSIIWIAVMLTYLLGDVIRIFAGDVVLGEIDGAKFTQGMGLGIAALMVTPILMVVLSLVLPQNANRWANIIVAVLWFLFNLAGIRTYPGHYDKFLLAVSMVFNGITVWYAWKWI
jgi:ABC-type transport system involved in cytochrome c biogenesis permease component